MPYSVNENIRGPGRDVGSGWVLEYRNRRINTFERLEDAQRCLRQQQPTSTKSYYLVEDNARTIETKF